MQANKRLPDAGEICRLIQNSRTEAAKRIERNQKHYGANEYAKGYECGRLDSYIDILEQIDPAMTDCSGFKEKKDTVYSFIDKEYEITKAPLSVKQIKSKMAANDPLTIVGESGNLVEYGQIEVVIELELYDLIWADGIDEVNEIADRIILGHNMFLGDISYNIVGCSNKNTVLVLVSAEVRIEDPYDEEDIDDE